MSARGGPRETHGGAVWRVVLLCLSAALLGGCASAPDASTDPRLGTPHAQRVQHAASPEDAARYAALPWADTFARTDQAPRDDQSLSTPDGSLAQVNREIPVYNHPEGQPIARMPGQQLGAPTWVPVIDRHSGWARVLLPSRPNGSTGWIRLREPEVSLARTPFVVDVDLTNKRLTILENPRRMNARRLGTWSVGIGAADTPTPPGRTFIMAAIQETVTKFSPVILPLGTHSPSFTTYGGGPGTVALHGWPDPAVFGQASSDGCVRVPPDALERLSELPLGTPVMLR